MTEIAPIRVRHERGLWSLNLKRPLSAVRLHSLLAAAADRHGGMPPRGEALSFEFSESGSHIGSNGVQFLIAIASWQDGEEELVLTKFRDYEYDYVLVHRFEYDCSAMTSHQVLGVLDLEQADWLATALRVHLGERARLHREYAALDFDAHRPRTE